MRAARVLVVTTLTLTAACTSNTTNGSPTGPSSSSSSTPPASTSTASTAPTTSHPSRPPLNTAAGVFAAMTEAQRVGQLLMVGCPTSGIAGATLTAIQTYHVGSVILNDTNSDGSSAISALTAQLETDNPSMAKLFIATDQEGGLVQRLQGAGFSTIPSAVIQGTYAPLVLRSDATVWGRELRRAGVTIDLAPVLDIVPAGFGSNPPIGDLDREYGHTPVAVTTHGVAVAQGLAAAGVDATAKHFPGLGRVSGNTDLTAGVQDTVTTEHDAYLQPFATAIQADVPFVMVSTAIYSRIDPGVPAIFSSKIITGMLRNELGFRGVVITDDIGGATQMVGYPLETRAVRFVAAGGDMVLTVDPSQAGELTQALLARAAADPAFKALVNAAVLRVLKAKQARGLLG